jgi:hypothetical protein
VRPVAPAEDTRWTAAVAALVAANAGALGDATGPR